MLVVSDTTPILTILKMNRLSILQDLFGEIIIPQAVWDELVQNDRYYEETIIIKKSNFIKVEQVDNEELVNTLCERNRRLHKGESEAIVLCLDKDADILLMDENEGRNEAKLNGVRKVMGSIGIFALAIDNDLLSENSSKLLVQQLKSSDRWIKPDLINFLDDVISAKFMSKNTLSRKHKTADSEHNKHSIGGR